MVHIVSILNLTCYETQVNRQQINIILKELTKSNEDIRALFNITNQLASQVQVQSIMLHLRAMLANLRDCLYEATSKPCTGIHRHCHHRHPNTTSDTCTRPTENAVPNRIRTTSQHAPTNTIFRPVTLLQISPVTRASGGEPILTTDRCTHSG